MSSSSYDIIIVGGGTAGLALASRLSEEEDLQVVVIESGEDRRADPKVLSPGMWPLLSHDPSDWACETALQESLLNSVEAFPLGRMLGGCSGINSFLFTPTSQKNVDAWAQLGNKGWDYASFDKSLKKSYTFHTPSGTVEGNGPIQLRVIAHESEPQVTWAEAWRDSIANLGFPPQDPFSGQVCGSFNNPESVDPATKQRSFSANAYLGAANGRANLTVITGAAVTKIILSSSNPDGVLAEGIQVTQTLKDGTTDTTTIRARREVILCGGAVNSPRLLELSGIGDGNLLKNLGIEVVLDNPHVGENLQNHVYTGVVFEVRDDANVATLDSFFRSDPQAVGAAMEEYSKTGFGPLGSSSILAAAQLPFPGILTEDGKQDLDCLLQEHLPPHGASTSTPAFTAAHADFVKSVLLSPKDASANYLLGPAYTEFEKREEPGFRAAGNYITVAVMLSHPLSRGSVHITTTTADGIITGSSMGLDINPRYLSHPLDLEVLARHIQFAEQAIGRAEPLGGLLKPRANRFGDLDSVKEYIRKTAKGGHHYTGTCAMMPRELGGVVNHDLRVHGCLNLRVCDASIVPIEPRGNTQAVVYGVAEMGAELIRDSLWSGKH